MTGSILPDDLNAALRRILDRLSDPEREESVSALCREHPEHADSIRQFVAARTTVTPPTGPSSTTHPERVGPYRILSVLGEGGMGIVYLAEQKEPVRRRVALKVIKLGMDSKEVLLRFEAERQALAMMSHDGIAKVFDAGTTERGQAYFVMEHITGARITEHCDRHRLTTKERLQLFQQVCAAVQHAHQKGVIHRDLKPSNILVSVDQGKAVPKIIDFGVARATDHQLTQATIFTEQGQIIGTPEYMSPEQAEMSSQDIDTRTDIYSLGVILYELLVGELPFSPTELRRAGLDEIRRKIREDEPPKPSTRITTLGDDSEHLAKRRKTSVSALLRDLKGDLDWIVMMAMDKDRNRRYGSANELAADLQRHLGDEPVVASPPSAVYRVRKFVRRYRGQVTAAGIVFATLIGGVVSTTYFMFEADARAVAEAAAREDEARARRDEAAARREAEANLANFDLLANVVRLREAKEAEKDLYPAWPEKAEAMRTWIAEWAEPLEQELPKLRQALRELSPDVEALRAATTSAGGETVELRNALRIGPPNPSPGEQSMRVAAEYFLLGAGLDVGTSVFLHDTLATLVADLAAFVNPREQPEWVKNPETGELVKVLARLEENPEAGELAKVRERLEWAEKVESLSITNHESKWEEAREAIRDADGTSASSLYAEHPIDLEPQMGLVPIGMNPVTKLWEFYHLRSAADPTVIPEHDEEGNIEVTPETGIIFVLIPGATFLMGAQKEDPAGPNYDPLAESNETPYHETLESYFLARHELTQAQWERLSGGEKPSREGSGRTNFMGGTVSLTHPVEEVSWDMCNELLTGHALDLPSEAQWEYACRAGTATPWFTGTDANSLAGHANILDETGAAEAPSWGNPEGFDDGFVIHAPVGSLLPNEFGMFDMHGNVWEWCREPFGTSSFPVTRGGSFQNPAQDARSANRDNYAPSVWDYLVGSRAARAIQ